MASYKCVGTRTLGRVISEQLCGPSGSARRCSGAHNTANLRLHHGAQGVGAREELFNHFNVLLGLDCYSAGQYRLITATVLTAALIHFLLYPSTEIRFYALPTFFVPLSLVLACSAYWFKRPDDFHYRDFKAPLR